MKSRYYSDNESKSDKAGLAAGAATTAGGGALLVHTLRKKGKGKKPKTECVQFRKGRPGCRPRRRRADCCPVRDCSGKAVRAG